jgi:hypothetical protein
MICMYQTTKHNTTQHTTRHSVCIRQHNAMQHNTTQHNTRHSVCIRQHNAMQQNTTHSVCSKQDSHCELHGYCQSQSFHSYCLIITNLRNGILFVNNPKVRCTSFSILDVSLAETVNEADSSYKAP